MLNIISVYDDVLKDSVNKFENGDISIPMFNRMSRRAELWLLDWLSGDVSNAAPPIPYLSQKNKDWLSPFIKKYPAQVVNGSITKPEDYYGYENFYRIGSKIEADCEDDEPISDDCNTPIEILDGDKFNQRCLTYIKSLRPSFKKPITKLVGNNFEVNPKDLGSVILEYVRYPIFGEIKTKFDAVYNEVVPDEDTSINYEWQEWARPFLGWCITDLFANNSRENALKQFNQSTKKSERG